jgi:hypothetical protein
MPLILLPSYILDPAVRLQPIYNFISYEDRRPDDQG